MKTDLYDCMKDFQVSTVTTETLGMAFEPEQRFENPDSSDIIFDRDYFGKRRGQDTIPGPFCAGKSEIEIR